jgi:heptosyltransferase-2
LRLAAAHLWRRRFELAINPRWDADYCHAAVIAYLSGARWRIGYSEDVIDHKRRLNRGLNRLYTHVLDDDTHEHEVQRDLNVVRFLGGTVQQDRLELWIGDGDAAFARATFKQYGIDTTELVVGFGPSGGASPLKQWPVCNFIQLGRWLETTFRARIVVLGAPGEEALGWDIERGLSPSAVNLVGKTTLRQAAAVLRCCDLYVGNDSGPMHIAAAMGVPVVALFGSSCPHRFGVRGNGHRVLWASFPCSPCCRAGHLDRCRRCVFDRPYCMSDITVAHVKGAILDQLLLTGQTIPFLHDACSDRHAATAEGAVALFLQKQGIVSL